jgi:hypothetical protein
MGTRDHHRPGDACGELWRRFRFQRGTGRRRVPPGGTTRSGPRPGSAPGGSRPTSGPHQPRVTRAAGTFARDQCDLGLCGGLRAARSLRSSVEDETSFVSACPSVGASRRGRRPMSTSMNDRAPAPREDRYLSAWTLHEAAEVLRGLAGVLDDVRGVWAEDAEYDAQRIRDLANALASWWPRPTPPISAAGEPEVPWGCGPRALPAPGSPKLIPASSRPPASRAWGYTASRRRRRRPGRAARGRRRRRDLAPVLAV